MEKSPVQPMAERRRPKVALWTAVAVLSCVGLILLSAFRLPLHQFNVVSHATFELAVTATKGLGLGLTSIFNNSTLEDSDDDPYHQLERFLAENPDAPGSRFVRLLREHLHFEPGAEAQRMAACWKNRDTPLCFGGLRNYRVAQNEASEAIKKGDPKDMEKRTRLVQLGNNASQIMQTVYDVRRYRDDLAKETIPNLGSNAACLPLMLAGYAASRDDDSVVLELGPFAGLSSRCIVTGIAHNGVRENSYFAFDTFAEKKNYNAIIRQAPWLATTHKHFTERNTDFLFLWKLGVQPVYPAAKAMKGWITKDSLNPSVLFHHNVTMLSIDCAKNAQHLKSQLEGLGTIRKGTIIFLMDFQFVRQQVKQVYGCLRERFLLPIYASNLKEGLSRMEYQVQSDVAYLEDLQMHKMKDQRASSIEWMKNATLESVLGHLRSKSNEYGSLARMHGHQRRAR